MIHRVGLQREKYIKMDGAIKKIGSWLSGGVGWVLVLSEERNQLSNLRSWLGKLEWEQLSNTGMFRSAGAGLGGVGL